MMTPLSVIAVTLIGVLIVGAFVVECIICRGEQRTNEEKTIPADDPVNSGI